MRKLFLVPALIAGGFAAASQAQAAKFDNESWSPQVNLNTVYAHIHLYGDWIGGDLRANAVAIGNNAAVTFEGSSNVGINQTQMGDVGATIKANVFDVHGDASIEAIGICNNASVDVSNGGSVRTGAIQRCNTLDPFAVITANLDGVGGDATVRAVAIGNNLNINASGVGTAFHESTQVNPAQVYAGVTVNLIDVGGDAAVTAAAIGNNFSITKTFGE